jgi:putative transposase
VFLAQEKAMPVAKNKPTTLSPEGSTSESSSPVVPEQEEFRQHLRRLAVSAVQVLIEQVMREELEQCIGKVAEKLLGVAPSASAVSRLNQGLTEQYEAWRVRPLLAHYRVVYLDGIHFTVRHGTQTDATMILTALGVDLEGSREVLAFRVCAQEDKDGWSCLLQDLRNRGVRELDLIVTDGHDGLLAAVSSLFPATLRQRCLVHKQRNVLNAVPKREQQKVSTELAGIWKQEKKEEALLNLAAFKAKYQKRYPEAIRSLCEDEEHLLTFYAFPPVMHRYIRSTNAIESLFSNVRQRTDQIDAFTTETSCLTIVWAVMQDIRLPKIPVS